MPKALTGNNEEALHPLPDGDHLDVPNKSWLSRLSANHRRQSMGFSEIAGTSLLDDENSNSFQGTTGGFVIPKNIFGGAGGQHSIDTPSPGDESVFGMQGITLQTERSDSLKEELGHRLIDAKQIDKHLTENNGPAIQPYLKELVSTAVPITDFPVATQESLEQLEGMRTRLEHSKDELFEMEVEEMGAGKEALPSIVVDSPNKPKGMILSKIMQSGFAQNWFFKTDDNLEEIEQEPSTRKRSTPTAIMDEDESASFEIKSSENSRGPKKFSGLLDDTTIKRELREHNFMAPQGM